MNTNDNEKSAQRYANTAHALAVVKCGHCPPATHTNTRRPPQTGPITIHCAAKLSMQCKNNHAEF